MKGWPDLKREPGLLQIPPYPHPVHPRSQIFAVLHWLLDTEPDALAALRDLVPAAASAAADRITREFWQLIPVEQLQLPAGVTVSSHSFREMGATCAVKAWYSPALCCDHGFWRRFATLQDHYYFPEFPYSRWMTLVFDFLASR